MKKEQKSFTEQFLDFLGSVLVIYLLVFLAGLAFTFGIQKYTDWFVKKDTTQVCPDDYRLSMVENNNMKCTDVRCDYYFMCVKDL